MSGKVSWVHKCLESDAATWVFFGWVECGRTWVPSLSEYSVLLEWRESGEPVIPCETVRAAVDAVQESMIRRGG